MSVTKFSPTEQKILELLSDGLPHKWQELHGCLWDELSGKSTIQYHVSNLRKKLASKGETIVCEYSFQKFMYRHVRLLRSSAD